MTTTTNKTTATESDSVRQRLRDVGLYGLAVQDHAVLTEPWVERVIDIEDRERKRRSLERRLTNARIGAFKPVADFDWTWPKRIDRPLIEELFSLDFVDDATNIVLVGPNGVGKSMLIKNLLHHAVLNGFTARFTTASDMLHELAAQDSDASLARRLRRFTGPQLLAIDEVGYLNYDNRYADLLFEVVTRSSLARQDSNSIALRAEHLARQETLNILRHCRNEAVFQAARNGLILLLVGILAIPVVVYFG